MNTNGNNNGNGGEDDKMKGVGILYEELNLTHFQIACVANRCDIVRKLLSDGQDPNCLVPKTGDAPLHLALAHGNVGVVELLMENGANPNLANEEGSTPLHVICMRDNDDDKSIDRFLKVCDDKQINLELDARDKSGLTPLQLAVVHSLPYAVEVLLDRGADIANFKFPTAAYFVKRFDKPSSSTAAKLASVSRALAVVRNLEKKQFKLDRDDALIIMNYCDWCRLLDKPANLEENWYQKEEFREKAFDFEIKSWLTLLDLVQLQPIDAENLVDYTDYCELSRSDEFNKLPDKYVEACVWRLCDTMATGFIQRYALEPFREQRHKQPSRTCCCGEICRSKEH